jgi:hypothetical protein
MENANDVDMRREPSPATDQLAVRYPQRLSVEPGYYSWNGSYWSYIPGRDWSVGYFGYV